MTGLYDKYRIEVNRGIVSIYPRDEELLEIYERKTGIRRIAIEMGAMSVVVVLKDRGKTLNKFYMVSESLIIIRHSTNECTSTDR